MKNIEWKLVKEEVQLESSKAKNSIMLSDLYDTYVCVVDGEEVGYIDIDTEDNYIFDIYVFDTHRGLGYGKLLVEKCLSMNCIKLDVTKDNERAINLYSKKGFEIVKQYKTHYTMKRIG